jgi:hypothetical protein
VSSLTRGRRIEHFEDRASRRRRTRPRPAWRAGGRPRRARGVRQLLLRLRRGDAERRIGVDAPVSTRKRKKPRTAEQLSRDRRAVGRAVERAQPVSHVGAPIRWMPRRPRPTGKCRTSARYARSVCGDALRSVRRCVAQASTRPPSSAPSLSACERRCYHAPRASQGETGTHDRGADIRPRRRGGERRLSRRSSTARGTAERFSTRTTSRSISRPRCRTRAVSRSTRSSRRWSS